MALQSLSSLDEFAQEKLAALKSAHLLRRLVPGFRRNGVWIERDGRRLLSFCCNDYLNLTQHPKVKAAAQEAILSHGLGAGASRLVTGDHPFNAALEARLARLKDTEAAVLFGSGYLANIGIIPVLVGDRDVVLADERAHACIFAGIRLSGARLLTFRHNDVAEAESLTARHRAAAGRMLLVTDGVFSMDGDLAPLPELADLCRRYDAWLMTDDAHGIGVVGQGRGSSFAFDTKVRVDIQMGTLSKAVGSYGAYVCGSAALIELFKSRCRSLIYSTGLPPAVLAGAMAAIDLIEADADLVARPLAKARLFAKILGLPTPASAIVPIVVGDAKLALDHSRELEAEGFLVTAIRPPTVPEGTSRLRFTFSAAHQDADIMRLADTVRAWRPIS